MSGTTPSRLTNNHLEALISTQTLRCFITNFALDDDANLDQPFDKALRRRMTMRTMIRATIEVFSVGIGSVFADDGDGYSATTLFTSIPGGSPH